VPGCDIILPGVGLRKTAYRNGAVSPAVAHSKLVALDSVAGADIRLREAFASRVATSIQCIGRTIWQLFPASIRDLAYLFAASRVSGDAMHSDRSPMPTGNASHSAIPSGKAVESRRWLPGFSAIEALSG
jgi:hypothetical protein